MILLCGHLPLPYPPEWMYIFIYTFVKHRPVSLEIYSNSQSSSIFLLCLHPNPQLSGKGPVKDVCSPLACLPDSLCQMKQLDYCYLPAIPKLPQYLGLLSFCSILCSGPLLEYALLFQYFFFIISLLFILRATISVWGVGSGGGQGAVGKAQDSELLILIFIIWGVCSGTLAYGTALLFSVTFLRWSAFVAYFMNSL